MHRDIKPENVLVTVDGSLKVADFGTARLLETINMGMTMGPLGTVPYAPPERGTPTPLPAYDVYSFAVLTTVCLLKRQFTRHADVVTGFEELDLPPEVGAVLRSALAEDPAVRPDSASTLLAILTECQAARERRRQPETELFLTFHPPALAAFEAHRGLPAGSGADFVREDLAAVAALSFDQRPGKADTPDLEIAGQTVICKCQPHSGRPGVLLVLRVALPPPQVLEHARSSWWRPRLRLRFTHPTDPGRAASIQQDLLEELAEQVASRSQLEASREADQAFRSWRTLLRAKFALEDGRGSSIRFTGHVVAGSRVKFTVQGAADLKIGEGRLVRVGKRRVLFGEVEGLENDVLSLYVTRGKPSDLPRTGLLDNDAEASKSKLRREQAALDRVSSRRATRPELRELLLDPASSARPEAIELEQFIQPNLDEAKQAAVMLSLGSRDFTLVQGPPGTGKTTFIAELVAQYLARHPDSRIVLASQTHIALDNALLKIQQLCPSADLLRVGATERLTAEVEPLGLPAQLERWREEVVLSGRAFIRDYARQLGIPVADADVKTVAAELRKRREQLHDLRSRLSVRRAERKHLIASIEELNTLAPSVLEAAEAIEAASRSSAATDLTAAANRFLEVGVRLAAELEGGAPLASRLLEMESSLLQWQQEVNEGSAAEAALLRDLAESLGQPDVEAEELIAIATREVQADPRLAKLEEITADWHERFGKRAEFNVALIMKSQVIAATCVGLTGIPGVDQIPFDLCIVDEASKATATETLVPLASSRQWVLVGDDRQLPPFVEHALTEPELLSKFALTREEASETLFSVLADRLPESCVVRLTRQHRMQPVIGRLISECFYEGRLTSVPRDVSPTVTIALQAPVVWLDTSGRSDRHEQAIGLSTRNRGEAKAIARLLDRINWVAEQQKCVLSVAVLSGYDAQRREIVDALAPAELGRTHTQVRVATVDAYQGQEADIAIFSVTRSNASRELGFLRSEERVNVALSRARDGLIIVGDASFIDDAPAGNPLRRVLQHIRTSNDCIVEAAG